MRVKSISELKKAWFDYPDDPDKSRFEIGVLSPGEEREIQASASRVEFSDGGSHIAVDYHRSGFLRAVKCIRNWENVFPKGGSGKVMPCNDQGKMNILNSEEGLQSWVLERLEEISAEVAKAKEEEEKNS